MTEWKIQSLLFPFFPPFVSSCIIQIHGGGVSQTGGNTSVPTNHCFFLPYAQHLLQIIGKRMLVSHSLASLDQRPKLPGTRGMKTGLSDVYVGLKASRWRSSVSESLALYGVEERKWPWLLRGWLAALQPSESASTNCTYMAWPKNEITKDFGSEVFKLLSHM